MFDPKTLLDQFLGAGQGANLQKTLGDALTRFGQPAQPGQGGGQPAQGGFLGGAGDLLTRGRDYVGTNAGPLAAGAAMGGLLSMVLGSKTGRSLGGDALKLGGLAAIGGLAWKAYQSYQAGAAPPQPAAPAPVALPPPPATPAFTSDATALLVLRAMIAAAKADGHIDDRERARILAETPAEGDAKAFLDAELAAPLDIDALAALATSPELATQVYAASLVAIDPDTDVERAYLADLAERLSIAPALKTHLEATVAQAKAGGA